MLCVLLPGPGAGCNYQCAEYATCQNLGSGGPSTCVRKAVEGEPCGYFPGEDRDIECLGALQCEDERCTPPTFEPGSTCPVPEG